MDAAPPGSPPSSPRTLRTQSTRQRKAITDLAAKGLNSVQIARATGLHSSTIRRFLDKIQPEYQTLKDFRSGRADALSTLQAKNLSLQDKLIDRLHEEGLLNTLTPQQISGLLFALNTQHGTLYDKERLETGQSTANISTISKMLDVQVSTLYTRKQQAAPQPVEPVTDHPDSSCVSDGK